MSKRMLQLRADAAAGRKAARADKRAAKAARAAAREMAKSLSLSESNTSSLSSAGSSVVQEERPPVVKRQLSARAEKAKARGANLHRITEQVRAHFRCCSDVVASCSFD
jgi:hypothetical protein